MFSSIAHRLMGFVFAVAVAQGQSAAPAEEINKLRAAAGKEAAQPGVDHRNNAVGLLERALVLSDQHLGLESVDSAAICYLLGQLVLFSGDLPKSESLVARSLAIREKRFGPDSREVARTLNLLGTVAREQADYARAASLIARAVAIREKILPAGDPEKATSLLGLASVYKIQGNYAQSEPLYRQGLAVLEQKPGTSQPMIAGALNNIANLLQATHRFSEAEQTHQRALAIRQRLYSKDHPDVAQSLLNLGVVNFAMGRAGKAKDYVLQSIAIRKGLQHDNHPDMALSLHNLAQAQEMLGEHADALQSADRSLAIREAKLGASHPYVADSLQSLAIFHAKDPDPALSVRLMARSAQIRENALALTLSYGTEEQKRAYLETLAASTDAVLTLQHRYAPRNQAAAWLALDVVLQRKGRLLDAQMDQTAALRARLTSNDGRNLDGLLRLRARRAELTLSGPATADVAAHEKDIASLLAQESRLEESLGANLQLAPGASTAAAVQRTLARPSALVEIVRTQPYELTRAEGAPPSGEARYYAAVLRSAGSPIWIDLGDAAPIDRLAGQWLQALGSATSAVPLATGRQLHDLLIKPLYPSLGNATELYLSPDGLLSLVPFATLPITNGQVLMDRFSITCLPSGRDLLRKAPVSLSRGAPAIFANPAFGTGRSARLPFFAAPLPGTAGEARLLAGLLPAARLFTGDAATEAAVKALERPSILHLATHGYFFGAKPAAAGQRALVHEAVPEAYAPLIDSGLVLAGANSGAAGNEDGVLTALEIAGLDLRGTQLVVLSACDTGLGRVVAGDGVYGIRRALAIAGAASQVMTLWQVQDRATASFMGEFYRALTQGKGRAEALRIAQQKLRRSPATAHPYYWGGFLLSGLAGPL